MVSLKQLALYCRDYVDLISPSLLSRQAKQIIIPQHILDATSLYKQNDEIDYDSLILALNLELQLDQLEINEEDEDDSESIQELSEEEKRKLEIARALDDIYRKYETSSYTKQVTLRFGRINFSAQPLNDISDDETDDNSGFKQVEQYLFTVPITITYRDTGGARRYALTIDDSIVTTNAGFLNEFLPQQDRDELFKFIATSEADELTTIPLNPAYIDELWTKIVHFLQQAGAHNISETPDMENVLIILLPKVNYFLSQDLLGIIDAADDDDLLETSLSAWVDDQEMSINDPAEDDGSHELFFPFPYDNSQLQVLGKLGNRAAVVEGPPGTGKSQTIANILVHLAATGHKVLFVSQKDQAIRGVKDKLKTLDIPYLYGYLPDRSSRLHSEDDERDSAANVLKGIAQALYNPIRLSQDPKEILAELQEYKPQFNGSVDNERKYFELYNEWSTLDAYDYGKNSYRITKDWYEELKKLQNDIIKSQGAIAELEQVQNTLENQKNEQESLQKQATDKSESITKQYLEKTNYEWLSDERELLRSLSYADVSSMMHSLVNIFEANAIDRKANFIKSKINNMKLSKELNVSIDALPREMYESLKEIVFSDESKTKRYAELKNIEAYFSAKDTLKKRVSAAKTKSQEINQRIIDTKQLISSASNDLKIQSKKLAEIQVDPNEIQRIENQLIQHGDKVFSTIERRFELQNKLDSFKTLNPNLINEEIIREKQEYKSLVQNYVKNRLSNKVEEFRKIKQYRASLESIGRKLSKTKRAYKTFDSLKSNPENFEAMSGIIPIWMMGLDDASRVLPLHQNIFDYVIIDEASQCNISYALPAMYRSKHTILFGDTLQMRDTTTAFKSNERLIAIANKHKIPDDLQIKASEDSVKSVMDIAKLAGFQTTVLRNHYRSPNELIGFSNEWFYEPRGRRLQVINDDIIATEDGRVLTNHLLAPNLNAELSDRTNLTEAIYIRDTLLPKIKLDPRLVDKSIAILTFFNEQAELLRKVITDDTIKISVIEGIQGDEKDIVIYSFVIKSPQEKRRYIALTGESGEIRKEVNEGRVNVAFSRARLQVHTVTSVAPNLWPEGIWIKRYLEYVEERGRVNRLIKTEQHFDSKFEENVYDYLFGKLDPTKYTLTTQVESCGFKIDLVIRNIESGKKLAIECDGPTHFEAGDGQVRVSNDYERQLVLETAGWRFYRIIYSEWLDEESKQKQDLIDYITKYMKQAKSVSEDNKITNEQVYVPINVDVPVDFVNALKANASSPSPSRFGRKQPTVKPLNQVELVYEPIDKKDINNSVVETEKKESTPEPADPKPPSPISRPTKIASKIASNSKSDFVQLAELVFSPRRSIVISKKPDGAIWVNEKVNTDTFKGFTSKGFGVSTEELPKLIIAIDNAIEGTEYRKEFEISSSIKLVVHNPDSDTVDIRYFKTSDGYTGFLKKGIRATKPNIKLIRESLSSLV